MKFTEAQLEAAIIELLGEEGYPHVPAHQLPSTSGGGAGVRVITPSSLRMT